MLYDVLFIDDDFSKDGSDEKTNENIINLFSLYFSLQRENIRVIWTNGELDDLKKLEKIQLSEIRYIIFDLHLRSIKLTDNNKTIISKIFGILKSLNEKIKTNEVQFLINSKYSHPNIEKELQSTFKKHFGNKYKVEKIENKNSIKIEDKLNMENQTVDRILKSITITKHIELEEEISKKLEISPSEINDIINFSTKFKVFKKLFDIESNHSSKISNFNKYRNEIAHNLEINPNCREEKEKIKEKIKEKEKKIEELLEDFEYCKEGIKKSKKI